MEPVHHVAACFSGGCRDAEEGGREGIWRDGFCFRNPPPWETALWVVTFLSGTMKGKAVKVNSYAVCSEGTLDVSGQGKW